MSLEFQTVLAILCMALVTFACRAGGYAILRATRPPPFVEAMLRHLPGALFVAYVVPTLAAWGPVGWVGGAAAFIAQRQLKNFGLSVIAGCAAVALGRLAGL